MWYYDTPSGQCKNFYYGSCGGNANRFATEQECQLRCLLKKGLPNIVDIQSMNVLFDDFQEIRLVFNKLIKVMFVMIRNPIKVEHTIP